MKKKEALKELEKMTNCTLVKFEKTSIDEFANDYDELVDWCSGYDDQEILITEEVDIDDFSVIFYGSDDENCVNAWIVCNENEVFAYGYSED